MRSSFRELLLSIPKSDRSDFGFFKDIFGPHIRSIQCLCSLSDVFVSRADCELFPLEEGLSQHGQDALQSLQAHTLESSQCMHTSYSPLASFK